jgi:hypothetical protein
MFQNTEELTATHSWPPYNCGSHKMPTVYSRWDILSPRRLKFKHYHQGSATPPNSNEKIFFKKKKKKKSKSKSKPMMPGNQQYTNSYQSLISHIESCSSAY